MMEDNFSHQYWSAVRQAQEKDKEIIKEWIGNAKPKHKGRANPAKFSRIGNDYYKHITMMDAAGNKFSDLYSIRRQTLIDDYGTNFLKDIVKYDAFTNVPDHTGQMNVPEYLYNIYKPVLHVPAPGSWEWTEILLKHIFGDQYEFGLDYMQLLYFMPTHLLPILCLVSKENATGKTTFLNWLQMIFGENVIVVGNQDIHGHFNSHYAGKLIIAVDESRIDKQAALEKLKALATQKTIVLEGKFRDAYNVPFFGKFILCSNYEDNFINASDEDIRYWIRKLSKPDRMNLDIETDLRREVPAFLDYLQSREIYTEKKSRMWFAPDEITTDALQHIREESKSWLYKELNELVSTFFLRFECGEFYADPSDIKERFFKNNSKVEISYISKVLKNEFKLIPAVKYYQPFDGRGIISEMIEGKDEPYKKTGRAYKFEWENFVKDKERPGPAPTKEKDKIKEDDDALPF